MNAGDSGTNNHSVETITDFTRQFDLRTPKTWRRDWRASYLLHGWTSSLKKMVKENEKENEKENGDVFEGFGGITLEYVLKNNSNFTRAVYPAVRHALDHEMLDQVVSEQRRREKGALDMS